MTITRYKLLRKIAIPCADLLDWERWMEVAYRDVAKTAVGPLGVTTAFMGCDCRERWMEAAKIVCGPLEGAAAFTGRGSLDDGDPLLFETLILGEELPPLGWWASSAWGEAELAHAMAVAIAEGMVACRQGALQEACEIDDLFDALFEMTELFPRRTGLPMTVWVGPRGHARHDIRVMVNPAHGRWAEIDDIAVIAVRPAPRLIAGRLSPTDLQVVSRWIWLNEAALVDHWNGTIDGADLIERLHRCRRERR